MVIPKYHLQFPWPVSNQQWHNCIYLLCLCSLFQPKTVFLLALIGVSNVSPKSSLKTGSLMFRGQTLGKWLAGEDAAGCINGYNVLGGYTVKKIVRRGRDTEAEAVPDRNGSLWTWLWKVTELAGFRVEERCTSVTLAFILGNEDGRTHQKLKRQPGNNIE